MKQILKLVFLLVIGQTAFAQAPSNYTNINGRYRWIAGMFDSTFHIPKGSTPSLRTGGSTNSGGLFYNTSDSSVYTYTGTQWIKLRGSINPSDTTNKYVTQVYKKSGSDSIFYVKGGVHTWAFNDSTGSPGGGGGGKVYYFNGGVSMGTFGGFTMYELGDTANTGAAANFTRSTTGNIANFITDPNKPGLLQIPAGVWSVDAWLSETGGGANHAEIYVKVEKWDGTSISTIATSPVEQITEGNSPNLYTWSVSIPTTTLAVTDRIIIQFYIQNTNGKTVTLYTQNGYVGEVHTTFTTGIGAINGLTAPAQYLVTGTSGTDFNINSATATHTFNLPTASATNRGALSTTDWSTFNNKIGGSLVSGYLTKATGTNTIDTSQIYQSNGKIGVSTTSPQTRLMVAETASDGALGILGNASNVGTFKFYANNGSTIQSVVNSSSSAMQIGTFVNSEMNLITNSATRVSILNNGNVGIGSGAATDSMLTVENGARFKRGVRMSGLPTGTGTKSLRVDANGTLSVADTLANGISGTGTTNYIPKFTSSSAIGNSIIYETGGLIGIGTTTPAEFVHLKTGSYGTPLYVEYTGGTSTYIGLANSGGRGYLLSNNNDLVFATSSSATERMRLTSGGLLGLGTSSPAEKLDVYDNSASNVSIKVGNTSGALQLLQGNGAAYLYTATNQPLIFSNNNSEKMRLDASGNLGLGTSSPNSKMEILRTSAGSITSQLLLHNGSDNDGTGARLDFSGLVDGSIATGSLANVRDGAGLYSLRFYTFGAGSANNERMRLDASGNLGLGVTPSAWSVLRGLQNGRANLVGYVSNAEGAWLTNNAFYNGTSWTYQTSAQATMYQQLSGVQSWHIAGSGTAGNAISFTQAMTLDASGRLGIGSTSPLTLLHIQGNNPVATLYATNGATNEKIIYLQNVAGDFAFSKANDAYNSFTNLVTIKNGGNVGIGTTSPNIGTWNQALTLNTASGNAAYEIGVAGSAQLYLAADNSNAYLQVANTGSPLRIFTGGSERMRITSGGLVGIGTSNPTSRFAVRGVNSNSQIEFDNFGSGVNYILSIDRVASAYRDIVLVTNSSNNTLYAATSGNVGIGTTSPTAKLDITATSSFNALRLNSDVAGTYTILEFANAGTLKSQIYNDLSGGDLVTRTVTSANLIFGTNSSERMRITSGGNVGIGTTSPTEKLDLQGTMNMNGASGTYASIQYNGTTRGYYGTANAVISGGATTDFGISATSNLVFGTGGSYTERMRITSGGELLINTTSDAGDYKLQVNGNVYSTGNMVLGNGSSVTSSSGFLLAQGNTNLILDAANGTVNIRTNSADKLVISNAGDATFSGSIKTAAPSGGTAKPWKLGQAGVSVGGANTTAVAVEIDGTVYYLLTAYLPEPEPDPAALPSSGPSASYKPYNKPIPVKTTKDVEIENLRKEIEELKQLIKNK